MTRVALIACAVALALPAEAAADPPGSGIVHVQVPPGTSRVEWGRQLYAGNCASCHGAAGEGIHPPVEDAGDVAGAGPSLRGAGARAADFYLRTGYMPLSRPGEQPHRSTVLFSDRELDALVAYVASLGNGPPVPQPDPARGSVAEGVTQFTQHCAGCHQVVAQGGYVTGGVAPPLSQATAAQIAEAVRIGPWVMPRFSERAISQRQLDSIVAYVEYARHPDDPGGWAIGYLGPVPEGMVAWFVAGAALVATCVLIGRRLRT